MAKQFHFIVRAYENGEMSIDYDTALAVMPNGAIYNEQTEEWESEFDHSTAYEKLSEKLSKKLEEDN